MKLEVTCLCLKQQNQDNERESKLKMVDNYRTILRLKSISDVKARSDTSQIVPTIEAWGMELLNSWMLVPSKIHNLDW